MVQNGLVRGILETELMNMDERHRSVAGSLRHGQHSVSQGMIGTLIGLVNMLKDFAGFISN